MLVLSRKLGQSFHVGPEVRVTIVKIDRNSIRIGIEAPDDVSVQRRGNRLRGASSSNHESRGRLTAQSAGTAVLRRAAGVGPW